jgi:hypothetical protein
MIIIIADSVGPRFVLDILVKQCCAAAASSAGNKTLDLKADSPIAILIALLSLLPYWENTVKQQVPGLQIPTRYNLTAF